MTTLVMDHTETIQKLERLNQLETVTAEQRIRIEKYRTMYDTLKAEHEQLQDEQLRKGGECKNLKDEIKALESHCHKLLMQVKTERDLKVGECEELKLKIITPQKMEVLKIKLLEEIEAPFKQNIESLEVEVDRYRNEFNRLRYDYSFLKSEYEHEVSLKKTVFDEICAKFELEKDTLHKQIVSLTEELNIKTPIDMHKLRLLQKENTQLNLQVKALKDETGELRLRIEQNTVQSDQASRLQVRQISELSVQCKTLEGAKDTNQIQLERVQKELDISIREQDKLSSEFHKAERKNMQLKNKMEELNHCHKMELNSIKLDLTKSCCEAEQEKDSLQTEMNLYKSKSIVQESDISSLKNDLELKEKEILKRVQFVHEEEWCKINELECERTHLETQITSLEKQKLDIENICQSMQCQLEEYVKKEHEVKERFEREHTNLKNQILQEKVKLDDSVKENEKLLEIKSRYQKLLQSYDTALLLEQELKTEMDKLLQTNDMVKEELNLIQNDMVKQRELYQKNVHDVKRQLEDEKKELNEKCLLLEKQHVELKSKYEKLTQAAKKRNKNLKSEVDILSLQNEEFKTKERYHQLEKQTLMKSMSVEKERMKRKFDKYRYRQHQFSQVLNTSNFNPLENFSPDARKTSSFLNQKEVLSIPPTSNINPALESLHNSPFDTFREQNN